MTTRLTFAAALLIASLFLHGVWQWLVLFTR